MTHILDLRKLDTRFNLYEEYSVKLYSPYPLTENVKERILACIPYSFEECLMEIDLPNKEKCFSFSLVLYSEKNALEVAKAIKRCGLCQDWNNVNPVLGASVNFPFDFQVRNKGVIVKNSSVSFIRI